MRPFRLNVLNKKKIIIGYWHYHFNLVTEYSHNWPQITTMYSHVHRHAFRYQKQTKQHKTRFRHLVKFDVLRTWKIWSTIAVFVRLTCFYRGDVCRILYIVTHTHTYIHAPIVGRPNNIMPIMFYYSSMRTLCIHQFFFFFLNKLPLSVWIAPIICSVR